MNAQDLDEIVDKLMVFRGKMPRGENYLELTWYQRECIQEMLARIDEFIEIIDLFGLSGVCCNG